MLCVDGLRRGSVALAASIFVLMNAVPASAQDGDPKDRRPAAQRSDAAENAQAGEPEKRPMVTRAAAPSPNATINLINLLVKQGTLTEEAAAELIKQADDEAYVARQALRSASTKAEGAEKTAVTAAEAVSPPGTKRVTYVPEVVIKKIRDDVKKEVMDKAKNERWAAPGALPEWVSRIRFFGDVRVRYERINFQKNTGSSFYVNYNTINTGNPYDTRANYPYFWPTYNTDKDRINTRVRARLGMEADLYEGFWAGIRIATGESNSPVSFNQSLGASGGNFSKYSIWIDRAFIKYSPGGNFAFTAGRFDNPFFSPTDLVFHRDLGFDGFSAQVKYEVIPDIIPFAVGGVFPVFSTGLNAGSDFNFNTLQPSKASSHNKWLLAGQVGSTFRFGPEVEVRLGAAYYDFKKVEGRFSSPCRAVNAIDFCDTDLTRPSFAQKGNTYLALRNIVPINPLDPDEPRLQYFGLASQFRNVVLSGRVDLGHFHPVHVMLDGEFVRNVAWNKEDIAAKARANPIPAGPAVVGQNEYAGGNQGWLARLTIGHPQLKALWDWNFHVGYKWLESDAVIDAFTDSDFGLGGTNLKGYFVGASVGLGPNVAASARWMSANQISGVPYAVDIFQADLNAKF